MRRRRHRISNVAMGAIALALISVGTYLGFTKDLPFGDDYEIQAVFDTANNLRLGSPVRVAGVDIGEVVAVEEPPGPGEGATVTMRVEDGGLPIHKDAEVKIRPRIFLEGNFFVDVRPGSPSAPELGDGDVIPVNQTASPVQLDQVLTTLQRDTRRDLQGLLAELDTAFEDGGAAAYNRTIEDWEAAYRDSAIVNEATLGERPRDLSGYVEGAGAVAQALDRDPEALKALITDFATTANALARGDEALADAIEELPRTLDAAQPALARLNEAFPPLRRLVADLRPGVRNSVPAVRASVPFVRQLRGLVSEAELRGLAGDLRTAVPDLARLNEATAPLLREVRAASSCQNEVILPWTKDTIEDEAFPAIGPVFEESTRPLVGLAGESRSGDANGQWFRVLLKGGLYAYPFDDGTGRFFLTGQPLMGSNPPKPAGRPPLRPDVPCETQEPPDLRSLPDAPPEGFRVDTKSPEALALQTRAQAAAVKWLRRQLKEEGLDDVLKVTGRVLSEADLSRLGAKR